MVTKTPEDQNYFVDTGYVKYGPYTMDQARNLANDLLLHAVYTGDFSVDVVNADESVVETFTRQGEQDY